MGPHITIYIIVDHSDSMKGQGLGSANDIAANLVLHFKDSADSNPTSIGMVKIVNVGDKAVLAADTDSGSFEWNDILGDGLSNIGSAYRLINDDLSPFTDNFLVLISDGGFTDDYAADLSSLMENPTFSESTRVSVAVGTSYDEEQLKYFCGGSSNLFKADEIDRLLNMISRAFTTMPDNIPAGVVDDSDIWV